MSSFAETPLSRARCANVMLNVELWKDIMWAWLPDGYSQIFRLYVFSPSGFWTMAPLRYAAKFDPFLSLDCARVKGVGAQSKKRKGSNFAVWRSGAIVQKPEGLNTYNLKIWL